MRRLLALIFLSLCTSLASAAQTAPSSRDLVQAGAAFAAKGQYKEAMQQYAAAQASDPKDSMPPAMAAGLVLGISATPNMAPANREKLRAQAAAYARHALTLAPDNPVASEVLRQLADGGPPPLHEPSADAYRLVREGEVFFTKRDYANALSKYLAAAQADPAYSAALVYAGDCHYMMGKWEDAAALFRKAAAVEPLNAQAWRFLADALDHHGKARERDEALYGAIAAHPGQGANWSRLAKSLQAGGIRLSPLQFRPRVSATAAKGDGKPEVALEKSLVDAGDPALTGAWLAYGMAQVRTEAAAYTPFHRELEAVKTMLRVVAELERKGSKIETPLLVRLRSLHEAGQLEPAILLLMFREAYRKDLEAWKAANPDGIRRFVEAQRLMP